MGEFGCRRAGVNAFVSGGLRGEARVRAGVRRQGEACRRGGGRRRVARRGGVLVEAMAGGGRGGGRVYSTYI